MIACSVWPLRLCSIKTLHCTAKLQGGVFLLCAILNCCIDTCISWIDESTGLWIYWFVVAFAAAKIRNTAVAGTTRETTEWLHNTFNALRSGGRAQRTPDRIGSARSDGVDTALRRRLSSSFPTSTTSRDTSAPRRKSVRRANPRFARSGAAAYPRTSHFL